MKQKKHPKSSFRSRQPIIYGRHAVMAALANPERSFIRLWVTPELEAEAKQAAGDFGPFPEVTVCEHHKISQQVPEGAVHQGIALELKPLPTVTLEDLREVRKVVVLDQVTDPHNIGAILRSAAAFEVDAVLVTEHHAPEVTGVMGKAASGALEIVPIIRVTNLKDAMETLKTQGFWFLGLDGQAKTNLADAPHYDKVGLVLGAEGKGLRRLVREHCDVLVSLPMSPRMESLNVSNATAIALYALYTSK